MQAAERALGRAEFVLLCLFSIALPLVEAPKNIFWGLFFLLWLATSARSRNWGTLSRGWDALFATLILVPFVSVLANQPYPEGWRELGDIVGYISLGWMLSRSRLNSRQILILLACLIGAALVGVAQGYWVYATDPRRVWLQFNSVGHVNHSALYGMGIASVCVVLAMTNWFGNDARKLAPRALTLVVALAMLGVMISFGSRGALAAYAVSVGGFLLIFARSRKVSIWPVLAIGLVVAAGALALDPKLIQKTQINLEAGGSVTAARAEGAHTALEIWRHHRLTGVGPANFHSVSPEMVEGWVTQRGEPYVAGSYLYSSHAHNVYFNTLAERGLIGLAALVCLFGAWLVALFRRRPAAGATAREWLSWGSGWTGWFIVFAGGMFNTTLHHEHGMLAMVFLGLLLGLPPVACRTARG